VVSVTGYVVLGLVLLAVIVLIGLSDDGDDQ
jgi:hypothetical protein